MKYCWKCGVKLRGTNPRFCSECGVKLDDEKITISRGSSGGNTKINITDDFREAQRLYDINEYSLALKYVNLAIKDNNENIDYLILKALILNQLLRFDESADILNQSLKIKENLKARYLIAKVFLTSKSKRKAISFFREVENLYKDDPDYYVNLANIYLLTSDFNSTIKYTNKALSIDSKLGLGWLYDGCANLNIEKYDDGLTAIEKSQKYLDKSLEEYPASYIYTTYYYLITTNQHLDKKNYNIHSKLSKARDSIKTGYSIYSTIYNKNMEFKIFNLALDLVKSSIADLVEYNYFGVDFHSESGVKTAKLLQEITDYYINIRPSEVLVLKFKGDIYGRLGFHDKAVEYFDKVLKTSEPDFRVLGYKAVSLKELGRMQKAINSFKQMYIFIEDELAKDPRNIYLIREKAVTLMQLNRRNDALKCYDEILRIDPNASFVYSDKHNFGLL